MSLEGRCVEHAVAPHGPVGFPPADVFALTSAPVALRRTTQPGLRPLDRPAAALPPTGGGASRLRGRRASPRQAFERGRARSHRDFPPLAGTALSFAGKAHGSVDAWRSASRPMRGGTDDGADLPLSLKAAQGSVVRPRARVGWRRRSAPPRRGRQGPPGRRESLDAPARRHTLVRQERVGRRTVRDVTSFADAAARESPAAAEGDNAIGMEARRPETRERGTVRSAAARAEGSRVEIDTTILMLRSPSRRVGAPRPPERPLCGRDAPDRCEIVQRHIVLEVDQARALCAVAVALVDGVDVWKSTGARSPGRRRRPARWSGHVRSGVSRPSPDDPRAARVGLASRWRRTSRSGSHWTRLSLASSPRPCECRDAKNDSAAPRGET